MVSDFFVAFGMVISAFLIALAGAIVVLFLKPTAQDEGDPLLYSGPSQSVFLFKNKILIDASPMGRALLQNVTGIEGDWQRMLVRLEPLFPDLIENLSHLTERGYVLLGSATGIVPALALRLEENNEAIKITLFAADQSAKTALLDLGSEVALQEELTQLRSALIDMPLPAWRESAQGEVTWANAAYLSLVLVNHDPDEPVTWPLPLLFSRESKEGGRCSCEGPEGQASWYDLEVMPLNAGEVMVYAMPVDEVVKSENSLREFTQTMTRTFAQLPSAIAIFDSKGLLQIFNPALVDLTGLPLTFLVGRPTFGMFLDALRDANKIPEPRDYSSWRRQFIEMQPAHLTGVFQENWNLSSGQTYRISLMPQSNGAVAFLMENVTSEVANLRRLRVELATSQSVIDTLPDAVIVLARSGDVALANKAARALWPLDGLKGAEPTTLLEVWRKQSGSSSLWEELAGFMTSFGAREPFSRDIRLKDGRLFKVSVRAIYGGASMVTFVPQETSPPSLIEENYKSA